MYNVYQILIEYTIYAINIPILTKYSKYMPYWAAHIYTIWIYTTYINEYTHKYTHMKT